MSPGRLTASSSPPRVSIITETRYLGWGRRAESRDRGSIPSSGVGQGWREFAWEILAVVERRERGAGRSTDPVLISNNRRFLPYKDDILACRLKDFVFFVVNLSVDNPM